MILVTHDQPTEVLEPGEQSLDLPTSSIPAQWATILAASLCRPLRWAVISPTPCSSTNRACSRLLSYTLSAHQPPGQFVQEAAFQCGFRQGYFVQVRDTDANGERKTASVFRQNPGKRLRTARHLERPMARASGRISLGRIGARSTAPQNPEDLTEHPPAHPRVVVPTCRVRLCLSGSIVWCVPIVHASGPWTLQWLMTRNHPEVLG